MPFAISSVPTGIQDVGSYKIAVAQPRATQQALLYGVEISCQSGFSEDPEADIYVFNNPKAAEDFITTLTSTEYSFEENKLKADKELNFYKKFPGQHLVTAQRGKFNDGIEDASLAVVGIAGSHYCTDAIPYVTDIDPYGYPTARESYLTVVIVINNDQAVSDTDILVKTILMHS